MSTNMAFMGVRSSKFRHVFGKASRKEQCYENLLITQKSHDIAACAANPKFVAIVVEVAGGGAFIVLPLEKTGRIDVNTPKVTGHSGPVYDIKWCPFNDNLIASASDDCTVKLWHIPDGGLKANLMDPLIELLAHKRRATHLEWHPVVENVLFSAGADYLILVWDTTNQNLLQSIEVHTDTIYSISLNRSGSKLAATSRDKKLRIIEPRSGAVLQETVCHDGSKACKAVYLGSTGKIFTTGFSRYSDRQYGVWDESNLSSPLRIETIDSSSGVLTPFFDHDTKVVYVAGKGDGNIRYYEITESPPYCHFLSQFISGEPQRGLGTMPKRGCKVSQCEIFRFYKLHATRSVCEPISMIVPRKSDQFQPDIYPDTAAPTPALTIEEWLSGMDKGPVLMSMKTGVAVKTHRPLPLRASDGLCSDKNADAKFAFLTKETRADYRPIEGKVAKTPSNIEKEIKTSTNLDTKFQHLQQIWGCGGGKNLVDNKDSNAKNSAYQSSRPSGSPVKIPYRQHTENYDILEKPSPKTESELHWAYMAQCEELKLLRRQLMTKDRRIYELEDMVNQLKTSME